MESRRSTAAQFFLEEEQENKEGIPPQEKVVELLTLSSQTVNEQTKLDCLRKVQEIVIHQEANLLDNFFDEILIFQTDKSPEIRKFTIGFIEEACKKDNEMLPKVVANLRMLLDDQVIAVRKRLIQCISQLYRVNLMWLCRAKSVTDIMESTWSMMLEIKSYICDLLDNENDGVRGLVVKFLEGIILLQTSPEPTSINSPANSFNLDKVPLTLKIARPRKLEEEARAVFDRLVLFHGSPHISSTNLMICMGSLTQIALTRPLFMPKVIAALEMLHANLPPTLGKSQVNSVRKQLKLKLLSLLRHEDSEDYQSNITTLLTDLGATHQEVMKCFPKPEFGLKKRAQELNADLPEESLPAKRKRIDDDDDDYDDEDIPSIVSKPIITTGSLRQEINKQQKQTELAIDVVEKHLLLVLSPELVAELVVDSMKKVPDVQPPKFGNTYTPIAAAGTDAQIKHVARLLAAQIIASPVIGPVLDEALRQANEDDADETTTANMIATVVGGTILNPETVATFQLSRECEPDQPKTVLLPSGISRTRIKALKLSEITKPMSLEDKEQHIHMSIDRILNAEIHAKASGIVIPWTRIVARFASMMGNEVAAQVMDSIFDDLHGHSDLVFTWIYEQYCYMRGFKVPSSVLCPNRNFDEDYDSVLCSFLERLMDLPDAVDRDQLLTRLYLESPVLTEKSLELLTNLCLKESAQSFGIGVLLMKEIIARRPPKRKIVMYSLLELCAHEEEELRQRALTSVLELYACEDLLNLIEEYAVLHLKFLLLVEPPDTVFGEARGRPTVLSTWNEVSVKACLYLYMALMPTNEKLMHELAQVYVQTNPDIKRMILRLLDTPVKGMGMDSPELLQLVETCPKGAETLVTRIIHILTDKTQPSVQLVARVRKLYQKRVPDVRFLIPVLNGLTRKEVIDELPKFIKLNPVIVKEVFNRLLGTGTHTDEKHISPLTPAELLIALHNIDPLKCDMKSIIKATTLCFNEREVYTQEVLAVVMQQLMDQTPIPTLLMRTVIQSLAFYPRLIGFIINILGRLIPKQVWKQRKVWEGFIMCCKRSKPQSFEVLLQLPAPQLADVLTTSADLREPLTSHIRSLTDTQRAHIPSCIMAIFIGEPTVEDPIPSGDSESDLLVESADSSDKLETDIMEPVLDKASEPQFFVADEKN